MKDIVIFGAGGFGREVQWLIERINERDSRTNGVPTWNLIGYIDDVVEKGTQINGYYVLGKSDFLSDRTSPLAVVCAVGISKVRKKIIAKIIGNKNLYFPNLIDPSVQLSNYMEFGRGNIICAGTILTVNIKIADFCIINLDCTIGHDDNLSSYVTIYPSVNISGCVDIGERAEIGTGVQIIQGLTVGAGTIIGAGAVVLNTLPEDCTAVGIPCKPIKFHKTTR